MRIWFQVRQICMWMGGTQDVLVHILGLSGMFTIAAGMELTKCVRSLLYKCVVFNSEV